MCNKKQKHYLWNTRQAIDVRCGDYDLDYEVLDFILGYIFIFSVASENLNKEH